MSFLNNLGGILSAVQGMSGDQLAGHVDTIAGNANPDQRAQLGQHLLDAFTQHTGDSAAAATAAGTTAAAVASGSPDAVSALINYAKANPQVLQTAATAFMTKNPGALASLLPSLGGLFGGNK